MLHERNGGPVIVQGAYMQKQHDCILATMWGMAISWAVGKMTGRRTVVQAEDHEGMKTGTAGMRGAVTREMI